MLLTFANILSQCSFGTLLRAYSSIKSTGTL